MAYYTFVQVSEMKAEYFPPKVDIIIQNEIPTDFYILVSGAVVRNIICVCVCVFFFNLHSMFSCNQIWSTFMKMQDVISYRTGTEQVA